MTNSYEKFTPAKGKRQILIADDEMINREILGEMLRDRYEIVFACDGAETMEMIDRHQDTVSLVLLDVLMPVISGLEVLKKAKADPRYARIPFIVMTGEKDTEIESLKLGAIDFIPKPYPAPGVIKARIQRTIELMEDKDTIESTERDSLTGLYNKEFFYRYAQQMDRLDPEAPMDAVLLDISHFHIINERYGKNYGNDVLAKLGVRLGVLADEARGLACRRQADTFMLYIPHRENYEDLMGTIVAALEEIDTGQNRIRLRMGVYPMVDKSVDMDLRFDRAKMAADTIKGKYTKNISFYDEKFHQKQLYAEQLIVEFPTAIEEKQFQVYFQPKFSVVPEVPVLASAEALVRWVHPRLGMISPADFIPLFEDNGLVQRLDRYVWEETARQIREWKDRFDCSVPVSVNVSRVDLFDPNLPQKLQGIVEKYGLTGEDFLLEITESAYTCDSAQIIRMVENLQELGFRIEMDDFGTGYSSLHMISSLPIDALKLDMQFIRNAFSKGGNTHMLEVIIGIAEYLSVPVIAEGVESEDQLRALRSLGCDMVQGYFFSKPVPASDFEAFILQKKEADFIRQQHTEKSEADQLFEETSNLDDRPVEQLTAMYESRTREDARREVQKKEEQAKKNESSSHVHSDTGGIHLKTASLFFAIISIVLATALMIMNISVTHGYQRMKRASDRYLEAQLSASDLESASDYLTDRVRCFVVTGEIRYINDFFEEVNKTRRRDKAVDNLENLLEGSEKGALENLNTALALSNELINVEDEAMRLMVEAGDYLQEDIPEEIRQVTLSDEELELSKEDKKARAQSLVFDNNYMHYKDRIRENVNLCTQSLIHSSSKDLEQASAQLAVMVNLQTITTVIFLVIVMALLIMITMMIRKPLTDMVEKMQDQKLVEPKGVRELRFVTQTYNTILEENKEASERLAHEASHDPLTGLFNRGAYDLWMEGTDTEHIALILIDVDYFKTVNDKYGHGVGDKVLKRVAEILKNSFRSVDIVCRIGGDEFAVVMTRVNSSMRQLVENKVNHANDILQNPKDGLPPVSLSVGVAFSDRENPEGDIFKDADTALYRVKKAGRKGCYIY